MQAYRVETKVEQNGTLTINNLPLRAGDAVEIIILVQPSVPAAARYPLRGLPLTYTDPTEQSMNMIGMQRDCARYAYLDLVGA